MLPIAAAQMLEFSVTTVARNLFVISDKEIVHATQLINYSNAVPYGLNFAGRPRKTITTRSDGNIVVDVASNGVYEVRLGTLT